MKKNKPHVLIVDDQKTNLQVMEVVLQKENCEIVLANSGEKALELIFQYDFALILLDVQMPGISGYEVAKAIHSEKNKKNIPIIFVTAEYKELEHELLGYSSGAVDFIYKPFNKTILISKVRAFLELYLQKEELKQLKEDLENTTKAKDQFIACISQEIAAPLNSILGFSELMTETPLNPTQKDFMNTLCQSSKLLKGFINDLSDFSKIETKNITLDHTPINLYEIILKAIDLCAFKAGEKGVNITYSFPKDCYFYYMGDEARILQILVNFITNAIKFTSQGEIQVKIISIQEQNGNCKIHFSIHDEAEGISPGKLETIFSPTTTGAISTIKEIGGSGSIALSTSKSLIEMMDGKVRITSNPNHGNNVQFTINLERYEIAPSELEPKAQLDILNYNNIRILVADDNQSNLKLMEMILRKFNCNVTTVENGQFALNELRQRPYDLCFMDLHMPIINGFECTRRIREELKLRLPVIACSTDAELGDLNKKEGDFNDYIMKPVTNKVILQTIRKWAPIKT